jgi:hypothetical protein
MIFPFLFIGQYKMKDITSMNCEKRVVPRHNVHDVSWWKRKKNV